MQGSGLAVATWFKAAWQMMEGDAEPRARSPTSWA